MQLFSVVFPHINLNLIRTELYGNNAKQRSSRRLHLIFASWTPSSTLTQKGKKTETKRKHGRSACVRNNIILYIKINTVYYIIQLGCTINGDVKSSRLHIVRPHRFRRWYTPGSRSKILILGRHMFIVDHLWDSYTLFRHCIRVTKNVLLISIVRHSVLILKTTEKFKQLTRYIYVVWIKMSCMP